MQIHREEPTAQFLRLLGRLVEQALGPDGVEMLSVLDGHTYQIMLMIPSEAHASVLAPGAGAFFEFQDDRIENLVMVGISVDTIALQGFERLLIQLTDHAPDKVAFMLTVQRRLKNTLAKIERERNEGSA